MTRSDIVKKAIHFGSPERIPYIHWIYDDALRKYRKETRDIFIKFPPFILEVFYTPPRGWQPDKQGENEWHTVWREIEGVPGQNTAESPIDDLALIKEFDFPDAFSGGRFQEAEQELIHRSDLYVIGKVGRTLFERVKSLHGVEDTLIDLYLHQDEIEMLAEKITEFNIGIIEQWAGLGVDAVFFSDDYGFQRQLAMNPEKFRTIFKPQYKTMIDIAHKYGMDTILHSCGNVTEIIPDFIEIGLDVLQGIQPRAMDIVETGNKFSGQICFMGGMDAQHILPFGSPDDVRKQVEIAVKTLGTDKGGYILSPSTHITAEVPVENIRAMYEALQGNRQ